MRLRRNGIRVGVRSGVALAGAVAAASGPAATLSWPVSAEDWAPPRSGERLRHLPPVLQAVQALLSQTGSTLTVTYPADEAGQVWAAELKAWLVSLAIEPDRLVLVPAAAPVQPEAVELSVRAADAPAPRSGP